MILARAIVFALPVVVAAFSGCARQTPQSHASAVERAACRQRADEVYDKQHRDEVFRSDTYVSSTRDAPFAGSGLAASPSSGLSGRFSRDQMVTDCLRSSAGNVGASPAAPDPTPLQ